MRFLDDGPDIPDELLDARDQGDVVFVCGAGVSKCYGLPLFGELVDQLYHRLNAEPAESPAEQAAYDKHEYDRVLKLLSGRMVGAKFDEALAACLKPPSGSFQAHIDLLELSTDREGRTCLVTTNFDTLFERSRPDLPSTAAAALPMPNTERFYGIMHLHGRLEDAELPGLDRTDLVLTSAEFGDAYLRSGWAPRFVYDLMRCRHIVLIGYQADDPPMRYLLEVIDADRNRFRDLKRVYAFVPFDPGNDPSAAKTHAIWQGKGAKAIPYASCNSSDHGRLYETLKAWAEYARNPSKWQEALFQRVAKADPSAIAETDREQVTTFVRRTDGAIAFANKRPSGKWLKVFSEAEILTPNSSIIQAIGAWVQYALEDEDVIAWFATSSLVSDRLLEAVRRALDRDSTIRTEIHRKCWQAIFWSREGNQSVRQLDWVQSRKRMLNGETGPDMVELIVGLFEPRVTLRMPYRWPSADASSSRSQRPQDIIRIDFETTDYPTPGEALEALPNDADFLSRLCEQLSNALEQAYERADYLGVITKFDPFSHSVPSVARHEQNEHRRSVYPAVRLIVDLWERLVPLDRGASRQIVEHWNRRKFALFQRMALHAATIETAFDGAEAASSLTSLEDEEFW